MQRNFLGLFGLFILLLASTSACYRMPNDDEYSVLPMTNNKDITGNEGNPLAPNLNY